MLEQAVGESLVLLWADQVKALKYQKFLYRLGLKNNLKPSFTGEIARIRGRLRYEKE